MKCRERWISDKVDGELSPRRRRKLERHLERCPACREYARRLDLVHRETGEIAIPKPSPGDSADFADRLERRLRGEAAPGGRVRLRHPSRKRPFPRPRGWWMVPTGLAAAACLALLVLIPRIRKPLPGWESTIFSMDAAVQSLAAGTPNESGLEETFDLLILESLGGDLDRLHDALGPDDNPLLWEDLTQEELNYLEAEIRKTVQSES